MSAILISELKKLLSEMELNVFLKAVRQERFTNSSLVALAGKSKQAINKYIKSFLNYRYIYLEEAVGRKHYYKVDPRFKILADHYTETASP